MKTFIKIILMISLQITVLTTANAGGTSSIEETRKEAFFRLLSEARLTNYHQTDQFMRLTGAVLGALPSAPLTKITKQKILKETFTSISNTMNTLDEDQKIQLKQFYSRVSEDLLIGAIKISEAEDVLRVKSLIE